MTDDSSLLEYEASYRLGWMQKPDAIPALKTVVDNLCLHPIVRLKAAESLGAFGLETSIPVLGTSFQSDQSQEVRDTWVVEGVLNSRASYNSNCSKDEMGTGASKL
ncbi:deoxyhypusine hydroxylase [Olea europaea subsp. europaea]|uniref:Deoxyhypusine hydroxylase n=1 Tax=Olea europaea subsp. europaea TaxID=158383 RepID=A0A8S0SQU9_OLEEU|nr:deoxyhypusine hydroxylase [Olea europaea subsp. europaea]